MPPRSASDGQHALHCCKRHLRQIVLFAFQRRIYSCLARHQSELQHDLCAARPCHPASQVQGLLWGGGHLRSDRDTGAAQVEAGELPDPTDTIHLTRRKNLTHTVN